MTVYGPYDRPDGRKHVVHYDGLRRKTQSYPRYLMEQYLERKLETWEQVDHINNDVSDNRIENLQILSQKENTRKSHPGPDLLEFICPICMSSFNRTKSRYNDNQVNQKKRGPYCSKSCAGKAGMR